MEHPILRAHARALGFTLPELAATLAVAGITLTLVVPSFAQLLADNRVTTQINDFVSHLALARSTAVKVGRRAALCPSADGVTCLGTSDWHQGWLLFVDENRNSEHEPAETVVRATPGPGNSITLTSGTRKRIVYEPDGSALGGSNGTYVVCDTGGLARPKAVILSNPGRPRVSTTKPDGSPLVCP